MSRFFGQPDAPQHKDVETLGQALFDNESMEEWSKLYQINVAAIFFVSTAFMGLLAKGSEDVKDYWSCIINTTSVSGIMSQAQDHVRPTIGIIPVLFVHLSGDTDWICGC